MSELGMCSYRMAVNAPFSFQSSGLECGKARRLNAGVVAYVSGN
jgi:hypothetical protein